MTDDASANSDKPQLMQPKRSALRRTAIVAKAAGRSLIDLVPGLGSFVGTFERAEQATREQRKEEWALWVAGDELDIDGFANSVEAALAGSEGEFCRSALLESARAAVDAIDDAVIPSIGVLTNRYLSTKKPDLRTFRQVLSLLRTIDGEELDALHASIEVIATNAGGTRVQTYFRFDQARAAYTWFAKFTPPDKDVTTVELLNGDIARRVVAALRGDTEVTFVPPPSNAHPLFSRDMIALLRETLVPSNSQH